MRKSRAIATGIMGGGKREFCWKLRNPSLYFSIILRKAHYYNMYGKGLGRIVGWMYRIKLNRLSKKFLFQIPYTVSIGYGFEIVHYGRVIIAPQVSIGDNCNIFTGVTIGSTQRGEKKGVPTIGNNVWVGPNAVIVGKISIGNNCMLAGNCFVNFDVPDNSIVLGSPGRIIPKECATEGYINQQYNRKK